MLVAFVVVWVGAYLLMGGVVEAHAELAESTPADGSSVPVGLREITLTLTEDVSIEQSSADVIGPTGELISGTDSAVDRANRRLLRITTPPLTKGAYIVKWRVVTEDDNAISNGQISFSVTDDLPDSTPDLLPVLLLAGAVSLAVALYLAARRRNTRLVR